MDNMIIRKAELNDFESVYEILKKSILHPWSYDMCKEDFEDENSLYFIIEENDIIKGYAAFKNALDESTLMSMAIDEQYRNNGLGSVLLSYAINNLKDKGYKNIFLEVRSNNEVARKLYDNLDFNETGIRKNYYKDPVCDAITMSKKL